MKKGTSSPTLDRILIIILASDCHNKWMKNVNYFLFVRVREIPYYKRNNELYVTFFVTFYMGRKVNQTVSIVLIIELQKHREPIRPNYT